MKSVVLELKEQLSVDDDSAWFSLPVYVVGKNADGCKASLDVGTGLGEHFNTTTFPYRRSHVVKRGWENLISEVTLVNIHASRKKRLRIRSLKFTFSEGIQGIYYKVPKIYSGDIMNSKLVTAYGKYSNTWYGEMTPVLPFRYREGAYKCSLTVQDGFQKKPLFEVVKTFDFGNEADSSFSPVKALDGFTMPLLPQGSYWCTLRFRDPATGEIKKIEEFDYQVLESPAKDYSSLVDYKKEAGQLFSFVPFSEDFIFENNAL